MRWVLALLCLFLMGLKPIFNSHKSQAEIDQEFTNIYSGVQPIQFEITSASPSATLLQEGQMMILTSTGSSLNLVLRQGSTVYYVPFQRIQGQ